MNTVDYLLELYRAPYVTQDRIKELLDQNPEILVDLEVSRKVIPYRKPLSDFQLLLSKWKTSMDEVHTESLILATHDVWTWDDNFNLMWMAEAGRKRKIEIVAMGELMFSASLLHPHAPL